MNYLCNPSTGVDRSVQWGAFKFILHNNELYWQDTEDLLYECLNSVRAKGAMGEVHGYIQREARNTSRIDCEDMSSSKTLIKVNK